MKLLRAALLLLSVIALAACATGPRGDAGRDLKLQTIRHDWGTTYLYRAADDPGGPPGQ